MKNIEPERKLLEGPLMSNRLQEVAEGTYLAEDKDGRMAVVERGKAGEGWTVKHEIQNGQWECVEYDEQGTQVGVYYER